MKSYLFNGVGLLSLAAASLSLCGVLESPAFGQYCPITFPASPGNQLSSDITIYPYWNSSSGIQQQLLSWFLVDVSSSVSGANPPIPCGLYPAWCVDESDAINPAYTVPGSFYTGVLYSTCDPNLNNELTPGHPNTMVPPATWQMVNYILNNQTYNGTRAFYWDAQAAINSLVGSGAGLYNDFLGYDLPATTPIPNGIGGYPAYDPVVVQALLTAATNAVLNNTPPWTPQCGDVYGVIYVTTPASDQFLLLEVPVPCTESVSVSKQIACAQQAGGCGGFGKTAEGFLGANEPAFCYLITIANTGSVPLNNITVSDSLMGNLTPCFVANPNTVLLPGASLTESYKMPLAANAVNTVTVQGAAVNTGTAAIATGALVSATDQATAVVDSAGLICSLLLSSPQDLDKPPIPGVVLLPSGTSPSPLVSISVLVVNTGKAALNVTIASPYLTCAMPLPVTLVPGQSQIVPICATAVACPGENFSVQVTGQAAADANHCAVYDVNGNPVIVTCFSQGTVSYASGFSGNVYLDCNGHVPIPGADSPLTTGLSVKLLTNSSPAPSLIASTATDINGHYAFPNIPAGNYVLQVVPPANYSQTYPAGSSPVQVLAPVCASGTQNFGFADHSPLTVICPPNVTIATNFNPIYCTFTPSDWNSSCNGPNTTPGWWVNWDQQNHGYNCMISWSAWYASCSPNNSAAGCWNFCQSQQPQNSVGSWWGASCNQNTAPSWCASYNYGNPNNNWWVPCNGYNPGSVLVNCFSSVYSGGVVQVGLAGGNCVTLNSPNAVRQCLGFSGTPGLLNSSSANPNSSSAGSFLAQVLALQLNCDFGDAGAGSGFGGPCGNLVLNDSTSPCNGWKVRDILKTANCVLGGGSAPSGCTVSFLCGLCANLNQCFEGCQVSSWCQSHLTPVYIPPPSVTGTPTVTTGACNPAYALTYSDAVAAGTCPCSYVITRTWVATASATSNYCEQWITITPFPGPSISGTIVNDCAGLGCSSGNNSGWNNQGGNNSGGNNPVGNSTPNFSGEAGLSNVTVTLSNALTHLVVATTKTDTNGNFRFANPGPGTFTVIVTPPPGFSLTCPATGTANQASVTITSLCQTVSNLLFAYMGNQTGVLLVKTGPATAACGGLITYNFAVTNTGNNCVALTVIDPLLGGQIFSQNSVAPGQGFVFAKTYTAQSANIGSLVNTAWAVANPAAGPNVTNCSSATTLVTTKPVTCSITCAPSSISPSSYLWCNARLSASPNGAANLYCQNATITVNCAGGQSFTYPVPNSQICFSPGATAAADYFDGTKWNTTVPSGGDTEIFLAGCGLAPNPAFARCQSITWTGTFTSDTPGLSFAWQFGSSCYTADCTQYSSLGVKACYDVPCPNGPNYSAGDPAGTPENFKSSCTGAGGINRYIGACGNSGAGNCKLNPCQ